MNFDLILVLVVLFGTLVMFMWGKIRYDLVALMALFIIAIADLVTAERVFAGFGHPAVITVASVLVVSKALLNAGIVDVIANIISKAGDKLILQITVLTVFSAIGSSFMNNVGALSLLLPVALTIAKDSENPPSLYLMPLAFGSILGGMVTLIGTPPNIIIATFRAQMESVEPFRMFDFAYVGGLVAFTGVIYIILIGWRILPKREKGADTDDIMKISEYLTEVIIPENSKIKGEPISELKIGEGEDITFVALIRNGKNYPAPDSYTVLQEGDILVIEASTEDLQSFIESNKLKMAENVENVILDSRDVEIIEAVVQPGAYIEGKTSANLYFWNHYPVNLLGVAREGERLKTRLKNIRFRSGDVLLLQGKEDALYEILPRLGGLPLAERELKLDKPQRILEAFLIFLTAIIIAAIGILPVQISFLGAAIIMILANFISLEEAYRSIDWPVIILLGAMFPLSEALESTGGTDIIANYILNIAERVEIWMALGVVFVGTMILSNIINNAAAAVLMAPIALNIAEGLNMSPDPFLMGVAISASSAFLTPIGHQSNTLVMGPGGYKFSDYWKMGLPLAVIVILTAIPLLLFFW